MRASGLSGEITVDGRRNCGSVGSLSEGVYPVRRPSLLGTILGSPFGARTSRATLRALGRAAIAAVEEVPGEPYLRVRLRGVDRTLWWPLPIDRESLYIVAQEQAYPRNPHNYEIPQSVVRPDDVVLDCGAAEGLLSLRVTIMTKGVVPTTGAPFMLHAW